jgi:hypothetical protein
MRHFKISFNSDQGIERWIIHIPFIDEDDSTLEGEPISIPPDIWQKMNESPEIYQQLGEIKTLLVTHLENLDDKLKGNPVDRVKFWNLFSDARWMVEEPVPPFLEVDTHGEQASEAVKMDLWCVSAAFYRSICLFLGEGNRYVTMSARLIYLFAAWQWYNLIKRLTREQPVAEMQYLAELGEAYRLIVHLLNEPEFSQAMRWLAVWRGVWQTGITGPLLREKMRLSLPLIWEKPESRDNIDVTIVIAAPGFFDIEPLIWTNARLHNVFADREFLSGRTDIRSLITEWLLSRYDFESTLLTARLLRQNVSLKWNNAHWKVILLCITSVVLGLILGHLGAAGFIEIPQLQTQPWLWSVVQWLPVVFVGFLAWQTIEHSIFPYLALPRVIGGIFIGYIALVVEDYSQKIGITLWTDNILPGVLLWAIILAAGFLYLYFDVRPLVGDRCVAIRRASITMGVALSIAMFSGMATVALVTAMEDYCVSQPNGEAAKCFLGLFGWVDCYQYLTFVPLALLTGLVTQFIFEERTVTASIWSSEQQ